MADRAPASAFVDGLARDRVSRGFLAHSRAAEPLHERNHLPDFIVGGAHGRHLGSRYSIPDGGKQVRVGAAMTVLPQGEVGPPAAFAAGSVAVGAVRLKQRGALFHTFGGVKWIALLLRP